MHWNSLTLNGRGLIRIAGLTVLGLLISAPAAAQGTTSGLMDLIAARTRVAYRYTHAPATGDCGPVDLPARGWIVAPVRSEPIGRTWLPGPNFSRWEPISVPAGSEPLEVNVVGLWCGPASESLLVERDGYYLEVFASRLAAVDEVGTVAPGVFLVPGGSGEPTQAMLREECIAAVCRFVLADAAAIGGEVRLAVEQRQISERERLAEAARRAEQMVDVRLQAGATVGVQSQAVAQRQMSELLQRYGATQEQAAAIQQRRVLNGMTSAMVRAALGEPTRINAEPGVAQTEAWTYPGRQIILFQDRVTEIR